MKTNIIVTLQKEGLHHWETCNIAEVEYLKNPHRHIFYITCKKTVTANDRQIEFISLKHNIIAWIDYAFPNGDFGRLSCESIASLLVRQFGLNYCKVMEDNENGAEVVV